MYRWLRLGTIALASAAILAASGIALAAGTIPDEQGVFHGCYKVGGALRVVDDPTLCAKNESAMFWHQTGPQGEPGPAGTSGPRGEPGLQGEPGPAGSGPATRWLSRWQFTRVPVGADVSRMDTWVWVMNPADPSLGGTGAQVIVDYRSVCGGGTSFFSTGAFVEPGRVVGPLFIDVPGQVSGSGCLEVTSDLPIYAMGHIRDFDEPAAVTEEPAIDPLIFFAVPLAP